MTFTGHNLYRGLGDLGSVDFATPVAQVPPGEHEVVLAAAGHVAGATYTYVLRPVVNDGVTPDVSCVTSFTTDAAGQWPGARPAAPTRLSLSLRPTATVRVQWRYDTPPGQTVPTDFMIHLARALPVDLAAVTNLTAPYARDGSYQQDISTGTGSFYIALQARTAGSAYSPGVIAGPIVVPLPHTGAPAASFEATD
jgi:hypothetical protein